jgi:hypothetical protein
MHREIAIRAKDGKLVVVRFEKRFVSGHRFSDAAKGTILNGFSS